MASPKKAKAGAKLVGIPSIQAENNSSQDLLAVGDELWPKNHIVTKEELRAQEDYIAELATIPGALKKRGEDNKNDLLSLYQCGFLTDFGYDQLIILKNGDLGLRDGRPLDAQCDPAKILTAEQLELVADAVDKRPPYWHTVWAQFSKDLRRLAKEVPFLFLDDVQDRVKRNIGLHLSWLEIYLLLSLPCDETVGSGGRDKLREQVESAYQSLFHLFGILPITEETTNHARRSWYEDWEKGDPGIGHDVRALKGGTSIASAIEVIMSSGDEVPEEQVRTTFRSLGGCLRELLHYCEHDGNIVTDVTACFGDVGIPICSPSVRSEYADLIANIQLLYDNVKRAMERQIDNSNDKTQE